jgi:hypothetical protein
VQRHAVRRGERAQALQHLERLHRPAARLWVCSTLTALVATVPQPAGRTKAATSSTSIGPPDRGAALDAAVLGGAAVLVGDDVRVGVADQLLGRRDDQAQADLVAHRAARHEDRRLVAEQAGDLLLQGVDRRGPRRRRRPRPRPPPSPPACRRSGG